MHWIEDRLGLSPDNGSGSTEAMLALALALVVAVAFLAWRRAARARRTR